MPCTTELLFMKFTTFILLCFLILLFPEQVKGTPIVNTEDFTEGIVSMHELSVKATLNKKALKSQGRENRQRLRNEKLFDKLQKVMHSKMQKKSLGSIHDSTDKWFWIWSISWGVGILLTIIAGGAVAGTFISILWLVAFVVGAGALIMWLIKKFG